MQKVYTLKRKNLRKHHEPSDPNNLYKNRPTRISRCIAMYGAMRHITSAQEAQRENKKLRRITTETALSRTEDMRDTFRNILEWQKKMVEGGKSMRVALHLSYEIFLRNMQVGE